METRIYHHVVATLALVISIVLPLNLAHSVPTSDDEYTHTLYDLRSSFGNVFTFAELDDQMTKESLASGRSKHDVAKEVLDISRKYQNHSADYFRIRAHDPINSDKHNNLADAQNTGDVFVSEGNNFFGWNHGHTGIFINHTTVVEAMKPGKNARSIHRSHSLAAGNASLQYVKTSQAKRDKAAARARGYIGRGYNDKIATTNRNDWGGLNCSQLVWASYYYGASIDLAPDDWFIYPYSIRDSQLTTTYQTINFYLHAR